MEPSLIDQLDPEIAEVVATLPISHIDTEAVTAIQSLRFDFPVSELAERKDFVVPGTPDLAVRAYRPFGISGTLPCLYWMHGGGFVVGSHTMDDPVFDELCVRLSMVVVSVGYRLAPETTYPGPLEDCYRGLVWLHEQAAEIRIDPKRIGVGGSSAGGGLAAVAGPHRP